MDPFYGTAAGARQYWADHELVSSSPDANDDDTVNGWLLNASEWLDNTNRSKFNGWKVGQRAQIREWPRNGATDIYNYPIDFSSVPREMIAATYEAAFQIGEGVALVSNYTPGKYASVKIEGAISVTYDKSITASDVQTQFPIIMQILSPILTGVGAASTLSGAVGRV